MICGMRPLADFLSEGFPLWRFRRLQVTETWRRSGVTRICEQRSLRKNWHENKVGTAECGPHLITCKIRLILGVALPFLVVGQCPSMSRSVPLCTLRFRTPFPTQKISSVYCHTFLSLISSRFGASLPFLSDVYIKIDRCSFHLRERQKKAKIRI